MRKALNRQLGADVSLQTDITDGIMVSGPFTEGRSFGFAMEMQGRAQLIVRRSGDVIPTGREIRFVSIYFETQDQDKDAEEPVDVTLLRNGQELARRSLGITERWGDQENQGPYLLRVPLSMNVVDCRELSLRIRKEPEHVSDTGRSWKVKVTMNLLRSDGSEVVGAVSPPSQWGEGGEHPFDRTFGLCGA